MSRGTKRVFISEAEQDRLVQNFIDEIPSFENDPQFYEEARDFIGENDVDFEADEEEEESGDDEPVLPPRKICYKSLDEVTDLDMFDPLPLPLTNEHVIYNTKDGKNKISWNSIKQNNNCGRAPNHNVIVGREGPRGVARHAKTEVDAWNLFISDEMLEIIIKYTNEKITSFREKFSETLEQSNKYTYCKLVEMTEVRAVFGIMYLRAAKHLNLQETVDVFHHESALDIFQSTMSINRFKFLVRMFSFDDNSTRKERWTTDKYAAFRDFFELMNKNNATSRIPSPYTSIDETLYPYRGHIGLKQYNPSKPAKYGLLYRSLCDASIPYTYWTLPYAGKPDVLGSDYYVTGTDEYTKYLVTQFTKHCPMDGRNISLDRYFTSVSVAEWCLSKKITIVGTMRTDRKGIAKEMKTLDGREEKSVLRWYKEDDERNMVVSYCDKKKSGMKNIIVLSTMHDNVRITKDQRKKPDVIVFYDYTKGGVDVVDLLAKMSTRMKSKRWVINALAFVLDTARTNAKTIFTENTKKKISNFEFTWNLGKALVLPQIQKRIERPVGLQSTLQQKMQKVTGTDSQERILPVAANCGRCYLCTRAIMGPGYKKNKNKLRNNIKTNCKNCRKIVCTTHADLTCFDCGHTV